MFIYFGKNISPLKVHISKLIFKETENIKEVNKKRISDFKEGKDLKFKEKSKSKINKDKDEQNPPKKFESLKIRDKINYEVKNSEDVKLVNDKEYNRRKKRRSTKIRVSRRRITNLDHIEPEDDLGNNALENKNKKIKRNNIQKY